MQARRGIHFSEHRLNHHVFVIIVIIIVIIIIVVVIFSESKCTTAPSWSTLTKLVAALAFFFACRDMRSLASTIDRSRASAGLSTSAGGNAPHR